MRICVICDSIFNKGEEECSICGDRLIGIFYDSPKHRKSLSGNKKEIGKGCRNNIRR